MTAPEEQPAVGPRARDRDAVLDSVIAGLAPLTPPTTPALVLRGRAFDAGRPAVMAIVNRTPDSFFAGNRHAQLDSAKHALEEALALGADLVDVGGVRAGQEEQVDEEEEIRRVVPFLEWARGAHPDVVLSLDTWRSGVARAAAGAGVDLINDTWAEPISGSSTSLPTRGRLRGLARGRSAAAHRPRRRDLRRRPARRGA